MEFSSCFFALLSFFLLISYCLALNSPLCHKEERSALLQFKQSFALNLSDLTCSGALPKLASWKIGGPNGNCCSWNGIECDHDTGYVIGLDLSDCCLYGSIDSNSHLFQLVHLQKLNLSHNNFNYSKIPEAIGQLSKLRYLDLSDSQFSGQIPYGISKLHNLSILDLSWNIHINSGKPLMELRNPDLRTLILNLTSLEKLHLSKVDISSVVPDFLTNFSSLKFLLMGDCGLQGKFLEKIFQLQNLKRIVLLENRNLYGYLPEFNSSNSLEWLWLSGTRFYGKLPFSIGNLLSLNSLFIDECKFSGSIPLSLGNLVELKILDLSSNNFSGSIPSSLGELAKLDYLCLSNNHFSDLKNLSWLGKLDKLRHLGLSGMNLRGDVLSSIQNLSSLVELSVTHSSMVGMLPQWLGNFSNSLKVLKLKGNMFSGSIPDSFKNQSSLTFIDLSNNKLQGRLPRSLSNCKMLEVIVLSNNQLNDVFPSWLGTLPNLRVLVLQSNQFYGAIGAPKTNSEFSKLHIIDVSYNNFYGNLPFKYMSNWIAMNTFAFNSTYMSMTSSTPDDLEIAIKNFMYFYSITIINKGFQRDFKRIQNAFSIIDLSCNRFEGEIPYLIGNLKGLQSLNLSYNKFTGQIPLSLGDMKQLEALDLSHNKLSGNIPQQLSQLTFLEIFNVSYNNFSGPIPQGNQLNTVDNSSYEGNPNMCGKPLSKKCQDFEVQSVPFSTSNEEDDQMSLFKFSWQIVLIGYGCGVVFGIVLGNCVFTLKQEWVLKTFRITSNRRHRRRITHMN